MNLLFQKEAPAMKSNDLLWSWHNARFTAVIEVIPLLIIAPVMLKRDCHYFLGILPAASIMGLPSTCKQRRKMIVIGILRHILNVGFIYGTMGPSCNSRYVLASIWYNTTFI